MSDGLILIIILVMVLGWRFQPPHRTHYLFRRLTAALAALGLMGTVLTSPGQAQPLTLETTANFGILAGTGITNTGPSVISGTAALPGDLGSSTATIVGFPPGLVTPPGAIHAINDGPTVAAKNSLTTAYNNLAGRPATTDLTGQNLGGLTLVPGVYNFSSSAQLTGGLILNGLGNPNSIFVFKIGSTLTTASASTVTLINGAQGGNVFWKVGSSATLGTATSFVGDILALTSITMNTSAKITCGAAWARNGAVTLDTNAISLCDLLAAGTTPAPAPAPGAAPVVAELGPTGVPLFVSLLPPLTNLNQRAVANALDTFIGNGGLVPLAFVDLFNRSPGELADAFSQLQGEAATGAAQAGSQAMNSFLSLATNPSGENRTFAPESPPTRSPLVYKAPVYKASLAAQPDPRRWGVWGAAYGSQTNTTGDVLVGSHDRSARTFGIATGFDYRVTPDTVVGFALAGGGTNFGLSGGLGGGSSDMFQAAVYSSTRFNAAYVSAAVAYAWHNLSTDRFVTVAGTDHLTANFAANNVGGRIEGGYRFAIPNALGWPGQFGFTPYAAAQVQVFHTPTYSESAASGSPVFALAYTAHTTTTTRTELGTRLDWTIPVDYATTLMLRTRAAWAHDHWSDPSVTASFLSLPGSSFTVTGAAPARDLLLASAGAEISFRNGFSLATWFDGELAERSQTYTGTARLRYIW